jgi:GNAT superfamily N-acetyltransferase
MMEPLRLQLLTPDLAGTLRHMTFPAYHHLLTLQQSTRHPDYGDARRVQPHAIGAWRGDTIVGLALLETPVTEMAPAELLSLFVIEDARNQGVATELVHAAERGARSVQLPTISAVYASDRPATPVLERVFAKREWSAPVTRAVTMTFTPAAMVQTDWFARVRWRDSDFEIFRWCDLSSEDRALVRRSHEERPWIRKGLEFWRHDHYGIEPVSSLGLRYRKAVVGWVINHRVSPEHVRFTCSFMRDDLARRGRILPLYTESIRRLVEAGCELCTLVTPVQYREMAEFLRRRCADFATYFSESRGIEKRLASAVSVGAA